MNFPRKIPKPAKRSSRWKSQAHLGHVRGHACSNCGFMPAPPGKSEAAHVRLGSHTGMQQKPDDHRTVALCSACHSKQHTGEATFWREYEARTGKSVDELIAFFVRTSPRRHEIELAKAGEQQQ